MILRDRKEVTDCNELSMRVAFTEVDVRKALLKICSHTLDYGLEKDPWTEQELRYPLFRIIFAAFPTTHEEVLTKWAFNIALRNKLIYPSAKIINAYFISESLWNKARRKAETTEE